MKISIDRNYTTIAQAKKVKEDIKTFRSMFCEKDLAMMASDAAQIPYSGQELLLVQGEAFPGGWRYDNETHFHFRVVLMDYKRVWDVSFYCDMAGTVAERMDNGDPMTRTKIFKVECFCR